MVSLFFAFPINMKKRVYLTKKVNSVFALTPVLKGVGGGTNENDIDFLSMSSPLVARKGLLSNFEEDVALIHNFISSK